MEQDFEDDFMDQGYEPSPQRKMLPASLKIKSAGLKDSSNNKPGHLSHNPSQLGLHPLHSDSHPVNNSFWNNQQQQSNLGGSTVTPSDKQSSHVHYLHQQNGQQMQHMLQSEQ